MRATGSWRCIAWVLHVLGWTKERAIEAHINAVTSEKSIILTPYEGTRISTIHYSHSLDPLSFIRSSENHYTILSMDPHTPKVCIPFLTRAKELATKDPVIAYWCGSSYIRSQSYDAAPSPRRLTHASSSSCLCTPFHPGFPAVGLALPMMPFIIDHSLALLHIYLACTRQLMLDISTMLLRI